MNKLKILSTNDNETGAMTFSEHLCSGELIIHFCPNKVINLKCILFYTATVEVNMKRVRLVSLLVLGVNLYPFVALFRMSQQNKAKNSDLSH